MNLPDIMLDALSHLCEDLPPDCNEYDPGANDRGHWWYIYPDKVEDLKLYFRLAGFAQSIHEPTQGTDEPLFDMTRHQINIVEFAKQYKRKTS